MEDFYYSYPAPKQNTENNNLIFEAPLNEYSNQYSGFQQVRMLYNSTQFKLRGGDGEEFTLEGNEYGKTLFSKGVAYPATWENPGIYNGEIKTNFLSNATQERQITFPDKSGEVALKSDFSEYVKQSVFSNNSLLIGLSSYQANNLEIITFHEILGS